MGFPVNPWKPLFRVGRLQPHVNVFKCELCDTSSYTILEDLYTVPMQSPFSAVRALRNITFLCRSGHIMQFIGKYISCTFTPIHIVDIDKHELAIHIWTFHWIPRNKFYGSLFPLPWGLTDMFFAVQIWTYHAKKIYYKIYLWPQPQCL